MGTYSPRWKAQPWEKSAVIRGLLRGPRRLRKKATPEGNPGRSATLSNIFLERNGTFLCNYAKLSKETPIGSPRDHPAPRGRRELREPQPRRGVSLLSR